MYSSPLPPLLADLLPPEVQTFLDGGGWYAVYGVGAVIVLLVLVSFLRPLLGGRRRRPAKEAPDLEEDLAGYPRLPPSTGDRRLTVEGVPVRLRLAVLAPAGTEVELNRDKAGGLLDLVLPGLGKVAAGDQARFRFWPGQLSYEGFANQFHRNTPIPEGEGEPSRWVLVAGRVKAAGRSFLLGLGLEALSPTSVGRRTLQPHEWPTVLRIRGRE